MSAGVDNPTRPKSGMLERMTMEDPLPPLLDLLERGPTEARLEAAARLTELADPRAQPQLSRVAREGTLAEATAAIEALVPIADEGAADIFVHALSSDSAKALADRHGPAGQPTRAVSAHRAHLREAELQDLRRLRAAAARALGALRLAAAVAPLAAAMTDPHPSAPRRAARRALLAIGTDEARSAVAAWTNTRRHRADRPAPD